MTFNKRDYYFIGIYQSSLLLAVISIFRTITTKYYIWMFGIALAIDTVINIIEGQKPK